MCLGMGVLSPTISLCHHRPTANILGTGMASSTKLLLQEMLKSASDRDLYGKVSILCNVSCGNAELPYISPLDYLNMICEMYGSLLNLSTALRNSLVMPVAIVSENRSFSK